MVEWLKHRTNDRQGLGSKPTCTILLGLWERHFTALSSAWWSWQAVLNYSNISTKLLAESNILASPEAGRGNCLCVRNFRRKKIRSRKIGRKKIGRRKIGRTQFSPQLGTNRVQCAATIFIVFNFLLYSILFIDLIAFVFSQL